MSVLAAVIAGLVATAVMTLMIYAGPMMGMPKMDMMGMLGTMFTEDEGTARIVGGVIHFVMGVIFALFYAWFWSVGIGAATWVWGLVFGAVHGVIAIIAMPMMLNVHPRPPEMELGPMTMAGMLMGHLVFGLLVALVYAALL